VRQKLTGPLKPLRNPVDVAPVSLQTRGLCGFHGPCVQLPFALAVLQGLGDVGGVDEVGDSAGHTEAPCCPRGAPDFLDRAEDLVGWRLRHGRPGSAHADWFRVPGTHRGCGEDGRGLNSRGEINMVSPEFRNECRISK